MDESSCALSATSIERLQQHALFSFQIQNAQVRGHVRELQEMLVGAKDEHDHFDLISELVHMIEDEIQDSDAPELYLLASLQHFTQEMALLREMDTEAALDPADITGFASIFARESSSSSRGAKTAAKAAASSKKQSATRTVASSSSSTSASIATVAAGAPSVAKVQDKPAGAAPVHPFFAGASASHATPRIQAPDASAHSVDRAKRQEEEDDDDLACAVCLEGDSVEGDPIVICELCSTAVHQTCYRIAFVPDGDWHCHPCARYLKAQSSSRADVTPTHELTCVACLQKGGALVPTREGAWMHMVCSMFLPEIFVKRVGEEGEVVCGVEKLQARRRLRCCFCKRVDKGACAQCAVGKCVVSYHVRCALAHGIKFAFIEAQRHFGSGCLRHQAQFLSMDGLNADEDDDENESGDRDAATETAAAPVHEPKETAIGSTAKTTATGRKEQQATAKKMVVNKRKRAMSWDSDQGTEKDEHVLITSDSDDDGDDDGNSSDDKDTTGARGADSAAHVATALTSSSKKRQVRPDSSVESERLAAGKPPKKGRQSMLQAFAKAASSGPAAPVVADAPVLQTRVFTPAFYPPPSLSSSSKHDDDSAYEYVMVLIERQPLGIAIASVPAPFGSRIVLSSNGAKTSNAVVVEALKRGVIAHHDEVFAIGATVLRNLTIAQVHDVIAHAALPVQCWFRTKRRSGAHDATPSATPAERARASVESALRDDRVQDASIDAIGDSGAAGAVAASSPDASPNKLTLKGGAGISAATTATATGDVSSDALSIDWPWFYLRSDGKVAMNLFWRSLDGAFFLDKINRRTLAALVDRVETTVGVRLRRDHAEYARVHELLSMPKRAYVPAYLRAFRSARKQKQTFLSSDIFVGVSADADAVDEQTAIAVGTVVTVAKRTWAGINKLGGAGRVRRVHEQTVEAADGSATTRFTYDIAYVLGGGEKKVERKYISVVDLNASSDSGDKDKDKESASGDSAASGSTPSKAPAAANTSASDATDAIKMRLSVQVERTDDATLLTALSALALKQQEQEQTPVRPTSRVFALSVSTENGNVQLTRKTHGSSSSKSSGGQSASSSAPELLLHKHFDVQRSDEDVIVNASFAATLVAADDRALDATDDLDDASTDASDDDEPDAIKAQLEALQTELRTVLAANEAAFESIAATIEREYATKAHRTRALDAIRAAHAEQMYRDVVAARAAFDASDEDASESDSSDGDGDDATRRTADARRAHRVKTIGGATGKNGDNNGDDDGAGGGATSESETDESFGGLFVNRVKQEGDQVCALCELSGGDFAATSCGRVVHPQCAMYTPETYFRDGVCHGVAAIPPARRALSCAICHGRKGLSKIQCASKRCVLAYHIACAFVNGLLIQDPHYLAWCPKHLKTSGMAHHVELPTHLQSSSSASAARAAGRPSGASGADARRASVGKKGRRETPRSGSAARAGAAAASTTTKKRKRKASGRTDPVDLDTRSAVVTAAGNDNILNGSGGDGDGNGDDDEPTCARRLDINGDDSESDAAGPVRAQAPRAPVAPPSVPAPTRQVFHVNDVVTILPREWIGSNKPGGVARIRAVHTEKSAATGELERFYDVAYVLTSARERRVEAEYVQLFDGSEPTKSSSGSSATPSSRKKTRGL